jgi:hypothetical protein
MSDPKQRFLADPPSFMDRNIVIVRNNMIASGGPYDFDLEEAPTHRMVGIDGAAETAPRPVYALTVREPSPAAGPRSGSAAAAAATASAATTASAAASAPAVAAASASPAAAGASSERIYWLRYKEFAPFYDSCTLGGAAKFFFTAELTGCRLDFGDLDTGAPRIVHISGNLVAESKAAKAAGKTLDYSKEKAVATFKASVRHYAGKYSMKTYGQDGIVTVWGLRDEHTGRWRFFAHKRVGPPAKARERGAKSSGASRWLQAGSSPITLP